MVLPKRRAVGVDRQKAVEQLRVLPDAEELVLGGTWNWI